jgi:hypothetical protein
MSDLVQQLDTVRDQACARLLAVIPNLTVDAYAAWLDSVYHATMDAKGMLERAAERVEHGDVKAALRGLAVDEEPHYLMAAADLATLGGTPNPEPRPEVVAYVHRVDSISGLEYLASLYVIESLAPEVGPAMGEVLERLGIGREQATFLFEHVEADVEHRAILRSFCVKYGGEGTDAIVEAVRRTNAQWLEIHLRTLGGSA